MTASALWQPRSTCDRSCLPRGAGTVPGWRRVLRLLTAAVVLVSAAVGLRILPARRRPAAITAFARAAVRSLGVRQEPAPELPAGPALLVANHVSWLDVPALLALAPVRLLAKHEVRKWPVVGRAARAAGTLFVDRGRPRRLPETVAAVTAALRGGARVAVFPEGTTWCGVADGRFRPAAFQAAVDAGVPVLPVQLSYQSGGAPTTAPAFVGEATLLQSVWRVAGTPDLVVRVSPRAPLPAGGAAGGVAGSGGGSDRRRLAAAAESVVRGGAQLVLSEPVGKPQPAAP